MGTLEISRREHMRSDGRRRAGHEGIQRKPMQFLKLIMEACYDEFL